MTQPNGTIETFEVTELYDGGSWPSRHLAYFLDPKEAEVATMLHGTSGPASTRSATLKVVWVDGKVYPLGEPVLGGPVSQRIAALEGKDKEAYDLSRKRGLTLYEALLKVLK